MRHGPCASARRRACELIWRPHNITCSVAFRRHGLPPCGTSRPRRKDRPARTQRRIERAARPLYSCMQRVMCELISRPHNCACSVASRRDGPPPLLQHLAREPEQARPHAAREWTSGTATVLVHAGGPVSSSGGRTTVIARWLSGGMAPRPCCSTRPGNLNRPARTQRRSRRAARTLC